MTARYHSRNGQRVERFGRYAGSPRFHCAGHIEPASRRKGVSWRALPVEGSAAWRRSLPFITRLFTR